MTTDHESTVPPYGAVSGDVPADEPVAPAEIEPEQVPAVEPVQPPAEPWEPAEPPQPPAEPAPPVEPPVEPVEPVEPAEPVTPVTPTAPPEVPAPPAEVPVEVPAPQPEVPAVPAPPAEPAPIEPVPTEPPVPGPYHVPPSPFAPPAEEPRAEEPPTPEPVVLAATPELASAVPTPVTETVPLPADLPAPSGGLQRYLPFALLLTVLVAGAIAWFGPVAGWRDEGKRGAEALRVERVRGEALAQSRQLALNITTLNHSTLDADLRRISESTTGKARQEFDEKILENEAYKKLVRDNQASLNATIVRIGMVPCGADDTACKRGETAVVLVFLDQESKNKLRPTPRVDHNRVALTLLRTGEKWLVSEVAVL